MQWSHHYSWFFLMKGMISDDGGGSDSVNSVNLTEIAEFSHN